MKSRHHWLAAITLLSVAGVALAATFTKFQPATGILKGNASTYVTTAATSTDVIGTFSGTCTNTRMLRADGVCSQVDLTTNVTGTMPVANGGTNLTSATDDNTIVGNGTTWQSKALPSCTDTAGNHLNYDPATNTYSCGTSVATVTGSFTASFTTGYTATQTQDFKYTKVGNIVVLSPFSEMTGTSNATNLSTASGAAPSAIRPATVTATVGVMISGTNNGTGAALCLRIGTDGTMSYGTLASTTGVCNYGGFAAASTKAALLSGGFNHFSYSISN